MRVRNGMWAGVLASVCWLAPVCAQPALGEAAPLSVPREAISPVALANKLAAAQRAHDFSQFSIAQAYYRELLRVEGVDQTAIKLALASVLLDGGDAADAEGVLATVSEPRTAAWHLRAGLAALELRKRDAAQAAWDAIKPAELSEADRPWHVFLEAALYDLLPVSNTTKANELYKSVENAANTDVSRARFQLWAERVRLRLTPPSAEKLEETRRFAEMRRGLNEGFETDKLYAVMLVQVNRKEDALTYLNDLVLRGRNDDARDEFNFLIGLIGDRAHGQRGRNALTQLLATGRKPERQRQALELLAAASTTGADRTEFRYQLDRLIAMSSPHPVKETLLYYRAQLALSDKEYATAESDAEQLLRDFPASRLRVHAFGILTQSMWDQQRYKSASDYARKAREALQAESTPGSPAARVRTDLGIFEAESLFRAGLQAERVERVESAGKVSFGAAAGVYAALLRERPPELDPAKLGDLMYQCVLAEIKAGSGEAEKRLNEFERDPAFDLRNRWDAEWSLARAATAKNDIAAAYGRMNRLLEDTTPGAMALPAPLRARMGWLRVKLSFDDRQPERTVAHADGMLGALTGLDENLHRDIASKTLLLKARAELALGRETAALETLEGKLRSDFAGTEAAVDSYLFQAAYYADQGKIDFAQRTLTALVDNRSYSARPSIPRALLQLAHLSEQLGSEESLRAANKRIEELLQHPALADDVGLIFRARLLQGAIFGALNDYPRAIQAYDELLNRYPSRPEAIIAQLNSARAYNALASADRRNRDIAKGKFEEVFYRQDADPGARLEAGYNLGALLAQANKPDEALLIWWDRIIVPEMNASSISSASDPNLGFWLGKTILDYAKLQEDRGRKSEAIYANQLIVKRNLNADAVAVARDNLQRLGVPNP